MPNTVLILPTTKALGLYLVSGTTLLIGGVLVWSIWQQHQKSKKIQSMQNKLSEQLDNLEAQKNKTTPLPTEQSNLKEAKASSILQTSYQLAKNSKNDLFEQLISDNIALRAAN